MILSKIIKEGEDAHKVYAELAEWCEDTSKGVMYKIKTGKGNVADLKATIEKEAANIAVQDSAIEDLAGQITTNEADPKAATEIRAKEEAAFYAEEKDLGETIDTLERAIGIIEKEMNGGAALARIQREGHHGHSGFADIAEDEAGPKKATGIRCSVCSRRQAAQGSY